MIYLDTETCGFHGLAVLLQWAEDDGPIHLYNLWKEPVGKTKKLIRKITETEICGFNLAFDWFHLCKIYTIWDLLNDDDIPEDIIEDIAVLEPLGRDGSCLKPKAALDLMLYARQGPYQSLMDRKDIRIRRVPAVLADELATHLEETVKLDEIYFSRKKNKFTPQWNVYPSTKDGVEDPDFHDVALKFAASGSLKNLAIHALKIPARDILTFNDVGVDAKAYPEELGWAPFALAIGKPGNWKHTWPDVIQHHIDYWAFNPLGRKYAKKDVVYTRDLAHHMGDPPAGDVDSTLACLVGAVRWHGFKIDIPAIKVLREKAVTVSHSAPKDPERAKAWILPHLDDTEQLAMRNFEGKISTAKPILEVITRWTGDDGKSHPGAIAARQVMAARKAKKEVELYDKLLRAGRFHASFVIIGTLSSRMAGSDGLNPQGINHKKEVRSCFPLADSDLQLCGGDFESFEVVLANSVYNDEQLTKDLTDEFNCDWCDSEINPKCKKCEGTGRWKKKIHGLFAMELYPGKSYDDIVRSQGGDPDMYLRGKSGVFSQIYGGDENTVSNKLAVDIDTAMTACKGFQRRYPGIGEARKRIFDSFCSMRQPKGLGTKVEWHDPADYVESLFGFRRYFTLENQICKALFDLAANPPREWKMLKIKVQRRERMQTVGGALMSALYGAAFQIQARNMRAAANHEIQSSGAWINKVLQTNIWTVQPTGIHDWVIIPMNIHDEIMAPMQPQVADKVEELVHETVESFRDRVPLIAIDWSKNLKTWADK